MLCLPNRWVYVWFEDGRVLNVANQDTLSKDEADYFQRNWTAAKHLKVVRVTLEDRNGNILKTFKF